jgi:hypothetical protein
MAKRKGPGKGFSLGGGGGPGLPGGAKGGLAGQLHQKLKSITIDPEVVNPEDVEMLQDLIVAAVNEAVEASQNLAADELGSITGGLNIPGLF